MDQWINGLMDQWIKISKNHKQYLNTDQFKSYKVILINSEILDKISRIINNKMDNK